MSEEREPYIVLGQEVEPVVATYHSVRAEDAAHFAGVRVVTHLGPSDLAVIQRRHLDRIIELLAAVYGNLDYDKKDEAMKLLEQVLTALTERTWAAL